MVTKTIKKICLDSFLLLNYFLFTPAPKSNLPDLSGYFESELVEKIYPIGPLVGCYDSFERVAELAPPHSEEVTLKKGISFFVIANIDKNFSGDRYVTPTRSRSLA